MDLITSTFAEYPSLWGQISFAFLHLSKLSLAASLPPSFNIAFIPLLLTLWSLVSPLLFLLDPPSSVPFTPPILLGITLVSFIFALQVIFIRIEPRLLHSSIKDRLLYLFAFSDPSVITPRDPHDPSKLLFLLPPIPTHNKIARPPSPSDWDYPTFSFLLIRLLSFVLLTDFVLYIIRDLLPSSYTALSTDPYSIRFFLYEFPGKIPLYFLVGFYLLSFLNMGFNGLSLFYYTAGYDYPPSKLFSNPFSIECTTLQKFWGDTWNKLVNRVLRYTVYQPLVMDLKCSRNTGMIATFVVSGMFHSYPIYVGTGGSVSHTVAIGVYFVLQGFLTIFEFKMFRRVKNRRLLWWVTFLSVVIPVGLLSEPVLACFEGSVKHSLLWSLFLPRLNGD